MYFPRHSLTFTGDVETSGVYKIAGNQVLGVRGEALIETVTEPVDTAALMTDPFGYETQEQADDLILCVRNLKFRVDEIEDRMQTHGLIA